MDRGGEATLTGAGDVGLRVARLADGPAIGRLHIASWRETYTGLVPAALLARLSAEDRSAEWRAVIEDSAAHGGSAVIVAETGGEIVGFAAFGTQRDGALAARGFGGEIGAIYVLRANQRAGVGRALMRMAARGLSDRGHGGAALWVLEGNAAARSFYERLGGTLVGEKAEAMAGATLREVAYGWSDLESLKV